MLVLEHYGKPLVHVKITPGNTATSTLATHYNYTEWTVDYTSGGTTEIVAGNWIVGATSNVKAKVLSISLASGTWAGGDAAGVIRMNSVQSSTGGAATWTSGENIKVAAGTNDATITLIPKEAPMTSAYLLPKGYTAKAALVVVYANTLLAGVDGGKPDQTALVGTPMVANSSIVLRDIEDIKNFKVIDYTASSAGIAQVTYYF